MVLYEERGHLPPLRQKGVNRYPMKIKSKIRSVQIIFSIFMFLIFTGLTGCKDDGAEFLEEELVQEENEKTSGLDMEQEDSKATESGESKEQSAENKTDISQKQSAAVEEQNLTDTNQQQQPEVSVLPQTIYVDICGAVTSPGVYELPYGSRVFQAIEKAGGYLPEAAASYLNRAKGLSDGQQIYVPTQAEVDSQAIAATQDGAETSTGNDTNNGNGQESAGTTEGASDTTGNGTVSGTDQKINLNTADVSKLTTLTGVGESKALAIIAYREENGPFTSIEDIMNVPGIKEGTYEKIKDKIAIE